MSVEKKLKQILEVVQVDVGQRGLGRDPEANLFNACPDDFALACRSIAEHPAAVVGVVTGFWIPSAGCGETDGPLGAVYLARTLGQFGVRVRLFSEAFCLPAMPAGCESTDARPVGLTHLIALERVGPDHVRGRCHTMRGVDISEHMRDIEAWFEASGGREPPVDANRAATVRERGGEARSLTVAALTERNRGLTPPARLITIGIGDGGNEIGMGKIPPHVIARNITQGERIACRVATDYLIVAGISNWGAYALVNGVAVLKGVTPPDDWYDVDRERRVLRNMVEKGPLVDGVTGQRVDQVDGLPFDDYIRPLREIERIVRH